MAIQEDEFCMPKGKEFLKLPFARHCIRYVDLQYCNSDIRRQRYNRINKKNWQEFLILFHYFGGKTKVQTYGTKKSVCM